MTVTKQVSYTTRDFYNMDSLGVSTSAMLRVHDASKYFLHKVLVVEDENRRQGTASCKTRSEVRGGGKKPWKQKGTGRARSGSSNSPLWNGGGVIFGPKPKVYEKKINSKEKQLAITTALNALMHRITVLKNFSFNFEKPNTKEFLLTVKKLDPNFLDQKLVLILPKVDKNTLLSSRNLPSVRLLSSSTLTLRALLTAEHIFISEEALLNFVQK